MARRISLSAFIRFRQRPAAASATAELSRSILATIDGAFILRRGHDDNGPRIVVMLDGGSGFMFTTEEASRRLARRFPELNEAEVSAATHRLSAIVRGCMREWDCADREAAMPAKRRWIDDY